MQNINRNKGKSILSPFFRWLLRIFLYGWAVTILFPLIWTVSTSFKSSQDFMLGNVWKWPELIYLTNYVKAWKEADMGAYVLNTIFVSCLSAGLCVIMISSTAYIIGKYDFKFVRVIEKFYFAAMMIQPALLLVPKYFVVSNIGDGIQTICQKVTGNPDLVFKLTDNLLTLTVVYACASIATQIFMLTGFVRNVNNGFLEAAKVDGAGEMYIFTRIVLPFIKPVVMFEFLIQFMGTWNDYLTGLTFLESADKYTLSVGIQKLVVQFRYQSDYGTIFAGLLISMVPMLILYIIFQKVIQNGMDMSDGLK